MNWRTKLRDWWRGYSDADMRSLLAKLEQERRPGEVIPLTPGEYEAMLAHTPGGLHHG